MKRIERYEMYRNNNVCTINLKFENLSESNIEQNILEKWGGGRTFITKIY